MTGLCGWIGDVGAGGDAGATLAAMAAGLAPPQALVDHRAMGPGGALALRGWAEESHFHSDGTLIVALSGYPRWLDAEFSSLAVRAGHAAAAAEAWRRFGSDFLDKLGGDFQLAVLDLAAGWALVAIDRHGIQPMCFAELSGKGVVFGATADAVRAHPAVGATVSPQGIYDYLFFYVSPAPRTIWREQRKLLPAQALSWRDGALRVDTYWKVPYGGAADGADLSAALRETLAGAVHRSVAGEAPERVGAFLSGGLDSTSVAAYLARETAAPACFTVGFRDEGFDEMPFARIGAKHVGARHVEHYLTPEEAAEIVPMIAALYDEPFGNSSAVPAFACARVARAHGIALMLAGDGGDEIFAGNERYVAQLHDERRRRRLGLLAGLGRRLLANGHDSNGLVGRAGNLCRRLDMALPARLYADNPLLRYGPDAALSDDLRATVDPAGPLALIEEAFGRAASADPVQRMMFLDLQVTLADNDLRKVGRTCELAGVRVKYPMLDDDVVALAARVPPATLLEGMELRRFYKRAMQGVLPAEILGKRKHGFGMPFGNWLRASPALRGLALDAIDRFRRRGYLRPAFLDRLTDDHRAGRDGPYAGMVWDLMMLELWFASRTAA
ncbi:MAG: asparagine synthetase B [Rhodospirillales bacterium]